MKNNIFILFFLLLGFAAAACDFCNCYLGINPHYKKNTFGLRYHHMPYRGTQTSPLVLESNGLTKKDFWETKNEIELHGQWYPIQRLQVIASLPYVINTEGASEKAMAASTHLHADGAVHSHGSALKTNHGIGDPLVLVHYQLFNKVGSDSASFNHRLLAGGGVKIPVGAYKIKEGEEAHERNHLPGTGSLDVLLSAVYLGRINNTGYNLNASYLFAGTNSQQFAFGNKFNINLTTYRQIELKEWSVLPNLGLYYEQAAKEWNADHYVQNSGGSVTYAHAGCDVYIKKTSFNIGFQLPVARKLNGHQAEISYRVITGLSYSLN